MDQGFVRATLIAVVSLGLIAAGCNSPAAHLPRRPIDDRQTLTYLASPELEGRGVGTAGLDRAADYIAGQFQQLGLRPVPGLKGYFQPFEYGYAKPRVPVKNVAGYIPGRRTDEYIVVGAHYDHLGPDFPGADDNASGTTALLMLAERFARHAARHNPPERSLIFVAFTGEEGGAHGSRYFVNHPPVSLNRIVAMLNLDMVGRLRPASTTTQPGKPVLYVGGSGTAGAFDTILRDVDARSPVELVDLDRGGIGPSDHMSFAIARVPVLFLFTGLHPDYHSSTDTAEKINYRGIQQVVDFAEDLLTQLTRMPRQQYVAKYDVQSVKIQFARLLNRLLARPTTQGYSSTKPATTRSTTQP